MKKQNDLTILVPTRNRKKLVKENLLKFIKTNNYQNIHFTFCDNNSEKSTSKYLKIL